MYYLFIMRRFVYIANWFVYIEKNHWFTAFLDSKIHTRKRTWACFSPYEPSQKNFVQIRPRFI